MPPLDIQKVRGDFPNLNITVHGKPLVYLDNAATTFKPRTVIDAVSGHMTLGTANVHRGVHYLSEQATMHFEEARSKVGVFLNARRPAEIIFTKGATESINLVAHSYGGSTLKKGDEIIISHMEHHSNIVPWQILCQQTGAVLKVIPMNTDGELIWEEYVKLLNPRTRLVSVVYVSNSLGTVNPIKRMIDEAHRAGAVVVVDAAQAVTHCAIDVQALDCDFLVLSGHKLFGPTGVGVLYGKERLLESMPPYQSGGDMIRSVTFNQTTYNTLPYKFEAGTPAIAEVIGLGKAIDYVCSIGYESMARHKEMLLAYGTKVLSGISGLKLIGTAKQKTSIISFVIDNIHPHDLGTIVDEEGVAIRTGHHCTQPVLEFFGIPATARASLAFYNTTDELDALVRAVNKAKAVFHA